MQTLVEIGPSNASQGQHSTRSLVGKASALEKAVNLGSSPS